MTQSSNNPLPHRARGMDIVTGFHGRFAPTGSFIYSTKTREPSIGPCILEQPVAYWICMKRRSIRTGSNFIKPFYELSLGKSA